MEAPRDIQTVWECPRCCSQLAQMEGTEMCPPSCAFGHESEEMEQRLPGRWKWQFEQGAMDG